MKIKYYGTIGKKKIKDFAIWTDINMLFLSLGDTKS